MLQVQKYFQSDSQKEGLRCLRKFPVKENRGTWSSMLNKEQKEGPPWHNNTFPYGGTMHRFLSIKEVNVISANHYLSFVAPYKISKQMLSKHKKLTLLNSIIYQFYSYITQSMVTVKT